MNMIHHYYQSKQGLFQAIVDGFSAQVFELPMRLIGTPAKSADDFASRIEMLFAATLDAYLHQSAVLMIIVRERVDPPALSEYMKCFSEFLERGKEQGFVRKQLNTSMITGAMLDRLLNQVLFAPHIKRIYGFDLETDEEYKRNWCQANVDLFLNGMVA